MLFTNFSIVTTSYTTCPGHLLFTNISIVTTSCTTCPRNLPARQYLLTLQYSLLLSTIYPAIKSRAVRATKLCLTRSRRALKAAIYERPICVWKQGTGTWWERRGLIGSGQYHTWLHQLHAWHVVRGTERAIISRKRISPGSCMICLQRLNDT